MAKQEEVLSESERALTLDSKIESLNTLEDNRKKRDALLNQRIQALENLVRSYDERLLALEVRIESSEGTIQRVCVHRFSKRPDGFFCEKCGRREVRT